MTKNKQAAITAAIMTVLVTVLRIILMPQLQDPATGIFHLGYPIILLMLLSVFLIFATGRLPQKQVPSIQGPLLLPTALFGILAGVILIFTSLFDAFVWAFTGKTPPPNTHIISSLDAATLILTLLFGVLAGLYFLKMGFSWINDTKSSQGRFKIEALMPVIWIWVRLARYELSYASAVSVTQSFYDFVMLIFTMLFLFSLARYVSGVGEKKTRFLPATALCTGLFSISSSLTRLAMYMMGETGAYSSSQLVSAVDFVIGVFAMLVAFAILFAKQPEEVASQPDSTDQAPDNLK